MLLASWTFNNRAIQALLKYHGDIRTLPLLYCVVNAQVRHVMDRVEQQIQTKVWPREIALHMNQE